MLNSGLNAVHLKKTSRFDTQVDVAKDSGTVFG